MGDMGSLNKASRVNPDSAETYAIVGLDCAEFGQYQNAIKYYNKAIRLKPDYADAYNNRGVAYSKMEDTSQGRTDGV
jgi:tetratricopeptide (TPR) repeat protein